MNNTPQFLGLGLQFIDVFILLAAIVVGFDCIWRVEKHLATFVKLLTISLLPLGLRSVAMLFGMGTMPDWNYIDSGLGILSSILILASLIELLRIVRSLDSEELPNDRN